jgi:hypothetical protein
MSKQRRLDLLCADQSAVAQLVGYFQAGEGLTVDRDPGTNTRGRMRELAGVDTSSSTWGLATLAIAIGEIGNGEEGGDNMGPDVAKYQGVVDDGGNLGAWCSGFGAWCINSAAEQLGVDPIKPSSWARTMFARCRKRGRTVDSPAPGDLMLLERGAAGGTSHFTIVERFDGQRIHTVEGNAGRAPTKVRRRSHDKDSDKIIAIVRLP